MAHAGGRAARGGQAKACACGVRQRNPPPRTSRGHVSIDLGLARTQQRHSKRRSSTSRVTRIWQPSATRRWTWKTHITTVYGVRGGPYEWTVRVESELGADSHDSHPVTLIVVLSVLQEFVSANTPARNLEDAVAWTSIPLVFSGDQCLSKVRL